MVVEHPRTGIRLKPNLNVSRERLGFSFKSNSFGLRNPGNPKAGGIVFGTSYAMGIAVDEGRNWHDTCLDPSRWFNAALPVGVTEWGELLGEAHQGEHEVALLVYHPNLWLICEMYERWRNSGLGAFEVFHWSTNYSQCALLKLKKLIKSARAARTGTAIRVSYKERFYEIDTLYCYMGLERLQGVLLRNLPLLVKLLSTFRRVVVLRVPVKQELLAFAVKSKTLEETLRTYDWAWEKTVAMVSDIGAEIHDLNIGFNLAHYHERDTHWNNEGNHCFSRQVIRLLPRDLRSTTA